MKRSDQDRLLRDVLDDAALSATRDAALVSGLRALRGRRRRRTLLAGTTASLAFAALLALLTQRRIASTAPAARQTASSPTPAPAVTMIDDAQLLALFPDRPAALIGPPGEQQLVFLDERR